MKKIALVILLVVSLGADSLAQLAKESWAVGFGFRYPRFVSVNVNPLNSNYGGFISLQRSFSEHVTIRLKAGYSHLEGEYTNAASLLTTSVTDAISGDLDFLYFLSPCEPLSPFLFGGFGVAYRMLDKNRATIGLDENSAVAELNVGAGIEWELGDDWKLNTEFGYHLTTNSELDGALGTGEINGKDSYFGIEVGLNYYFSKGDPSKYCQLYTGLVLEAKDLTDYDRIEQIVKSHTPKVETEKVDYNKIEGIVKKYAGVEDGKWVLIGVNFEFNSAKITQESYPVLYDAAAILLKNKNVNVEIQGYTDNIGSEQYNLKLSTRRAEAVKNFFVAKGVAASRLKAVGYGESNPIADNKTAEGRALNRRIEFKVQ